MVGSNNYGELASNNKKMEIYQERVVVFIDILGFGNLVESTVVDEMEDTEKVETIIECFNNALEDIYDVSHRDFVQISHFSDSFVISHTIDESYEDKEARNRLYFMVFLITKFIIKAFIKKDILLRGGITRGKVFHKENFLLFGPAMNKAYNMESKVAKYPRIIIDHEIIYHLKSTIGDSFEQVLDFVSPVIKDDDGEYFLSYFDDCRTSIIDTVPESNESLKEKKAWLKKYLT